MAFLLSSLSFDRICQIFQADQGLLAYSSSRPGVNKCGLHLAFLSVVTVGAGILSNMSEQVRTGPHYSSWGPAPLFIFLLV